MTTEVNGYKATTACNGATTSFAVPFQFIKNADLLVYLLDSATEKPTAPKLLALGDDYSITGSGPEGEASVVTVATYAAGKWLHRRRETDLAQTADYVPNDGFPAEAHETQLDRLSLITEELKGTDVEIRAELAAVEERTLRVPVGETVPVLDDAAARADGYLGFDSEGNPEIKAGTTAGDLDDRVAQLEDDVEALETDITQTLRVPGVETVPALADAATRADMLLGFDGGGDPALVDPGSLGGGGGGTTTNAATFNNSGTGAASGTTFDGSAARTISYNTIGADAAGAAAAAQTAAANALAAHVAAGDPHGGYVLESVTGAFGLSLLAAADQAAVVALLTAFLGIVDSDLSANGFLKFGNGFMIQWGSDTAAGNTSSHTLTYPEPYTTWAHCFPTGGNSHTSEGDVHIAGASGTTSQTIVNSAPSSAYFSWYSIGV